MNNQRIQRVASVYLGSILLVCVVLIIKHSWISADAPYYISIARDISEGQVLFKDIVTHYTPLVMALYSCVYTLVDNPPFVSFLVVHLLIILCTGILFFLLLRELKLEIFAALILATCFCLAVLSSDGNYIILESYSALFVILAFFFLLSGKGYFLAGLLLGCSFLCKQYGILNFLPFAYYILVTNEPISIRTKKVALLGSGGAFVFIAFFLYYAVVRDVDSLDFLKQISGGGYSQYSASRDRSLLSFLIGAKVFILFAIIMVFYLVRNFRISREIGFCLVGSLACLLPVYLQGFQHYYINTFPYLFLGLAFIALTPWVGRGYWVMVAAAATVSAGLLVARVLRYSENAEKQKEIATAVAEQVPVGSSLVIKGDIRFLYILNNYRNAALNSIGYDYLFDDMELIIEAKKILVLSADQFPSANSTSTEIKTRWGSVFIYRPQGQEP